MCAPYRRHCQRSHREAHRADCRYALRKRRAEIAAKARRRAEDDAAALAAANAADEAAKMRVEELRTAISPNYHGHYDPQIYLDLQADGNTTHERWEQFFLSAALVSAM